MPFKTIFKYYWMQIRKYRWSFYATFVLNGMGYVISSVAQPVVYKWIIDTVSVGERNLVVAERLMWLLALLVLMRLAYESFYRIADYTFARSAAHTVRELANYAFSQIDSRSYRFFTSHFTGALVAKSKRFIQAFDNMYEVATFNLWLPALQLIGILGVLLSTLPILGAYFFFWFIIYFFVTIIFIKRKIPYDLAVAAEDSKITARLSDVLTNTLNVKMFAARQKENRDFDEVTGTQSKARIREGDFENGLAAVQSVFGACLELGGMYLVLQSWLAGEISAGTVALAQIYFASIFASMWGLGRSISRFTRSLSDASEMVQIFEQPIEVLDPLQPETCVIERGKVVFGNVTFGYNPTNPVLKNFTQTVHAGERVGLVGSSGAGKTTITKLLLRFADVDEGKILIDGQNIAHITQDDLRRNIAYVPQDPVLFHRSLRENIAYGKPDATEDEIIEAARKAHAHEFISGFPHGYDTLVGERGVKLSGGERQRVAIARAILKNALILVLDEATSSLDAVSERYIQEGLEELMKGKTVIVIAHRLSTVRKMDRIVVLGENGIEEEGTHEMLLSHGGQYAAFWNHQTDGLLA